MRRGFLCLLVLIGCATRWVCRSTVEQSASGPDDPIEAFERQCDSQQVVGSLDRGFCCDVARSNRFANGRQTRPLMILQPIDIGADRRRAGFNVAVIGLDDRFSGGDLAGGVIEIDAYREPS